MAIRWPGVITPGSVIDDPVSTLDFAPTLTGLAGGQVDPAWKLDGIDLADRLKGRIQSLAEKDLFWRTSGSRGPVGIRRGKWKIVVNRGRENPEPQLFDLNSDMGEMTDVSALHPAVTEQLLERIKTWESELVEPLWGNEPPDDKTGSRPEKAKMP